MWNLSEVAQLARGANDNDTLIEGVLEELCFSNTGWTHQKCVCAMLRRLSNECACFLGWMANCSWTSRCFAEGDMYWIIMSQNVWISIGPHIKVSHYKDTQGWVQLHDDSVIVKVKTRNYLCALG